MAQQVLENLNFATMSKHDTSYGTITDGAIAINDDKIFWCGKRRELPEYCENWPRHSLNQRFVTPALIDCHTHLVYGGNRAQEFEMRLAGASYKQIIENNGGIHSTLRETRKLSVEELVIQALPRIDSLIAEGVSTVEIKSGYGLDLETELNMLRAARQIEKDRRITTKTSFLGAHLTPSEYKNQPRKYLNEVCKPAIQQAVDEGLIDAVDGFCESIAFSAEDIDWLFDHASSFGLPVKLHAEQLSNSGGSKVAAKYNALSADHLEYAEESDIQALSESGTVAVLLPGAFYTLRQSKKPPLQLLRDYEVPIAVATDCNPGTSPLNSILMAMNFSCTLFELTPEEALAGTTREAARALGLDNAGRIEAGLAANLAVWDIGSPAELSYYMGFNPLVDRMYSGTFDQTVY